MLIISGNISLWFAVFFCLSQLLIPFKKKISSILKLHKIAVIGLLISSLLSFFLLMIGFIISDFSITNVFQNSHTTKPLLYKIAGVWGNHEGSMLLWLAVLSIFNFIINRFYNEKNYLLISKTLQVHAFVILGFLIFIILTSNPFKSMGFVPKDGLGFNPILQDPALAIHPPLLYIGYVGFSAAFSISVAVMSIKNIGNIPWHIYMKFFVIVAWSFLTIGIALGSIWAYYELGWGGWWFWDPVENAALMPWLLGTALFHSLITVERKKSLQTWVLLLAILAFLLSVIGTFLVRSGILTSVHTFALDPSRGLYILFFITLLGGYSLLLFFIKSKKFVNENYFSFLSREGAILVNNILMVIVCASVFFGTTYPLFFEIITNKRISVGEPYFNSTIIPIIIPAILVMGIGPALSWGKGENIKSLKTLIPSAIITFITIVIFILIYKSYNFFGLAGLALSSWIISTIFITIIKKIKVYFKQKHYPYKNFMVQSKSMIIAHLGVGLMILGITGSSMWKEEVISKIKINEDIEINKYIISFKKIDKIIGKNYLAIQGTFIVRDKNNNYITTLNPENRYYPVTNTSTTEASIHTNLLRDLYLVLGDGNLENGWIIRIYNNPLVVWIWIGVIIIFIGGILGIINNLKNINKNNRIKI